MAFKIDSTRLKWAALTVLTAMYLDGCKPINQFFVKSFVKPAYDATVLLTEQVVLPYAFETEDLEMSCMGVEANINLVMSGDRSTHNPTALGAILFTAAGSCEEERAFQKELEYLRYIRLQQPDQAQDAMIQQKIHHAKAAKRFLIGWNNLVGEYKQYNKHIEIGGECPVKELAQEYDQIVWMIGMFAGAQAMNHDILSGVGVGVPKNLAAVTERAMGCLNNTKWFGIPLALKATIWSLLPGSLPDGEDNWARLDQADALGEAAGLRLPHLMHLIVAHAKGEDKIARAVIKKHAKNIVEVPAHPRFATLDAVAKNGVQRISDKMWTEATGHRTPVGSLGTFWDENPADDIETVDLDDLF